MQPCLELDVGGAVLPRGARGDQLQHGEHALILLREMGCFSQRLREGLVMRPGLELDAGYAVLQAGARHHQL